MKKFLLICSAMVLLYGNEGMASRYVDSNANQNSDIDSGAVDIGGQNRNDAIGASEADGAAYPQAQRMRERVEQAATEEDHARKRQHRKDGEESAVDAPQLGRGDRVITSFSTISKGSSGVEYSYGGTLSYHRLFCYRSMQNGIYVGSAAPTVVTAFDNPNIWNNIFQINYSFDVTHETPHGGLRSPKVTLTRKADNSCSISFQFGETQTQSGTSYRARCTINGLNERHVKIGDDLFAVYDIEAGSGAFTDDLPRLAYVDKTGLYIVPARENSLEHIADVYQREGEFRFNGPIIQISAMDGSLTADNEPITEDSFYQPWTKQKNSTVLINRYIPEKRQIFVSSFRPKGGEQMPIRSIAKTREDIDKLLAQSKDKRQCEELIRNGTFASMIYSHPSVYLTGDLVEFINKKITERPRISGIYVERPRISQTLYYPESDSAALIDPNFVRSLKPAFAEASRAYAHNKESEQWIPFAIVENL